MKYSFRGKLWKSKGAAAWHFLTLPKALATKIRKKHSSSEEGWGRLKVQAKIGKSEWNTAIWYDSKAGSYLLAVKAAVRKQEGLQLDDRAIVSLVIEDEDPKKARWLRLSSSL